QLLARGGEGVASAHDPSLPHAAGRWQVGCAAQPAALRRRGGAFPTAGSSCRSAALLGNRTRADRQSPRLLGRPRRERAATPPAGLRLPPLPAPFALAKRLLRLKRP